MIRIGNQFMITADGCCYTVNAIMTRGENTKDPGSEYMRPISYHGSVTKALESVSARMQREIVAEPGETSLSEAIRRMRDVEGRIGRMIEGRTGGL